MEKYRGSDIGSAGVWRELYRAGAYDELVVRALQLQDRDAAAERWLVRTFSSIGNVFLLSASTVAALEQCASRGDAYALFALGRYHQGKTPAPDSAQQAMRCFEMAWERGLPEAAASLAMAYDYGEAGVMDLHRATEWLNKSLELNCDYAAGYMLRKMIFGLRGTSANPQKALEIVNAFIEQETEKYGPEEVNPMWYYCKGCAEQAVYGWTHAAEAYRTAAEKGLIMAYGALAVAVSHNDDGELTDREAFYDAVIRGAAKEDALCTYFLARLEAEKNGGMPDTGPTVADERVLSYFKAAMELGSSDAAEELGDMYSSTDIGESFGFYARGAMLDGVSCHEKAFALILDGLIDKSVAFRDMLALRGARLGSDLLTAETVKAYKSGRLTEFSSEIERYYM